MASNVALNQVVDGSILSPFKVSGVVSGATMVSAYQSGTVIPFTQAGVYTITLPNAAAGLNYKFILVAAGAANQVTITPGSGNVYMSAAATDATATATTGGTTSFTFAATASQGDTLEVICDGTNWYGKALMSVHSKILTA